MGNDILIGLELLCQKENERGKISSYLEELPEITKVFFEYFDPELMYVDIKKNYSVRIKVNNDFINCEIVALKWFEQVNIKGDKYENWFGDFKSQGDIYNSIIAYEKENNFSNDVLISNNILDKGLLEIGYMEAYSDAIYLGLVENNKDEIWVDSSMGILFKISNDIFDFFSKSVLYWDDEDIIFYTEGKYSGKDVYREWGETEWRLRGLEPEPREEWENDLSIPVKSGLGLLKQRREYPEKMDSVLDKFPFRAKLFYKYYNTGTYDEMINTVPFELQLPDGSKGSVVEDIWWEDINQEETDKEFIRIMYKDKLKRLYTFEELEEEIERYKRKTDSMHLERYIYIGEMEGYEKILLGVSGSVKDKVILYDNNRYTGVFADIFDFFTHINRYWSDKDIVQATNGAKTGKDLYQNWGENFWRVKE